MTLKEMIYMRKSCRQFAGKPENVAEVTGYTYIGSITI